MVVLIVMAKKVPVVATAMSYRLVLFTWPQT